MQFLPAVLALNVGVLALLVIATLVFGRIYCSVICPLGVYQDVVSKLAAKKKKNRFGYSAELKWLRLGVLAVFVLAIIAGINSFVALIAPYSAYGRMASNILGPIWQTGNNVLAYFAERADSYMFYQTSVWIKSGVTFAVAIISLVVVSVLAWKNGRTYCNSICPVGTVLGYLSKFSYMKPYIVSADCNKCGLCARNCKASCIDPKTHTIDYSRCVDCFDCLEVCRHGAIKYGHKPKEAAKPAPAKEESCDENMRKTLISATAILASTAVAKAQMKVDGGFSVLVDKKIPERATHIVPPGAKSAKNLAAKCTACQLCISSCPNEVLRPSTSLDRFMQPEMSYERGYCRPECTHCSEVCPTGAIELITRGEKTGIQVGRAVWVEKNCVVITDDVDCGGCAAHCPAGAILMVPKDPSNPDSRKIPAVNVERCIGCGACENLCPAAPYSAIYVEGNSRHITL